MSWQTYSTSFKLPDGREVTLETGKLARQADGSVLVRMGNTVLLATVVSAKEKSPTADFFPLSVEYQEKFASAGRIPGGFLKRENKLSDYEILICRLIDRALRPLFPDYYYYETQVVVWLISGDKEVMPDCLAGLAASAAITISDIPFGGPLSEVRIARINGEFVINPPVSAMANADIDLMVGATEQNIVMVEGAAKECSEDDLVEAIQMAHNAIKLQCQAQLQLAQQCGKAKRQLPEPPAGDPTLKAAVQEFAEARIKEIVKAGMGKQERKEQFKVVETDFLATLGDEPDPDKVELAEEYLEELHRDIVRNVILDEGLRLDGRKTTDIRPLLMEVDFLPTPHGSALFCRGETQSITTVTLGTKQDEQMLDKSIGLEYSRFLLHYNFPPFSTGEVKPMRGPGRREIGHGNLAMRSLKQVLPPDEENLYTIRVVSDILESNGSSSMATVCAGSLALMDAGVQVRQAVSGIAMGLISEGNRVAVLSDILGDEDHLGDMDFKVTGTENGVCGVQMDIKIDGLSADVLRQALYQAREGRLHILHQMNAVISAPRPDLKPHAPRIVKLYIDKEFIGAVIGPGGKVIQEMQRETKTTINIEEKENGKGEVLIYGADKAALDAAVMRIRAIASTPEVGEVYNAKVKSIMPYGAFVEFMPGKEGLLHISEISYSRLENMEGVLKEGEMIMVKLVGVDDRTGKFKLSHKVLLPKPDGIADDTDGSGTDNRNQNRDRDRRQGGPPRHNRR
ncbi:polyribonucleotide nucleotidyltransferase [Sphingobacteriales bacterium UPWRP_1]|nr:polyribonucleotide nucleotidyltransferase [Sphingobacteriales bacterium TSM_CSM]PSJ75251.1 polyribonucleotide nucleotidyltransferase [Sphingobacteriales bacterium UPWRP_1]